MVMTMISGCGMSYGGSAAGLTSSTGLASPPGSFSVQTMENARISYLGPEASHLGAYRYIIEAEKDSGITEKALKIIEKLPDVRCLGTFNVMEK